MSTETTETTETIEATEKRATPRAQYFLVRKVDDYIPIYAFRSESDPASVAAVVTDLSEGGVQILSTISAVLDSERYALTLITGTQAAAKPLHTSEVRKVWTRPEGMYIKSGFTFTGNTNSISDMVDEINASEHQMLRCVLHPLD